MTPFIFNDIKYDADVLEKLASEGHKEIVELSKIKSGTLPARSKIIAFKFDGFYYLLTGSLSAADSEKQKIAIIVISKHTLKKADIEAKEKSLVPLITSNYRTSQDNYARNNSRHNTNHYYNR